MSPIIKSDLLFEAEDIFGKKIRTTKTYWNKIFHIKHKEVETTKEIVTKVLASPDEVRKSVQDPYIFLFYKKEDTKYLVVVVKYLNGSGFVVTIYKTSKVKHKGKLIWRALSKK